MRRSTMLAGPNAPDRFIAPDPGDVARLEDLAARIDEITGSGDVARLVGPDGVEVEIPALALHALKLIVESMRSGQTIGLVPHGTELSTQEAADLLHVSRPFLIDQILERGEVAFHKVGSHRRMRIEDVLAYRETRATERRDALRRLTEMSQAVEGGYR